MNSGRWILAAVLSGLVHVAFVGVLFCVGSKKVVVGLPEVHKLRVYQVRIVKSVGRRTSAGGIKRAISKAVKVHTVRKAVSKPKAVSRPKPKPKSLKKSEVLYKKAVKKKRAKKKRVAAIRPAVKPAKRKTAKVKHRSEQKILEERIRELEQEKYLEKRIEELKREVSSGKAGGGGPSIVSKAAGREIALSRSSAQLDPLLVLYLTRLMDKIRMNWALPEGVVGREAIVSVKIDRKGRLVDIGMEKSSGDHLFDESCMRAVRRSFPFSPLPPVYRGRYLEIGVRFKR